ncbi:uncharacterized protein LOC122021656 isoform X1 [Zingiber officinale]|uniref:uncharacterized protein LOC122021656 isoform X1 n=1 Tax=Zingiber officinale TaxID=94328 RepID=UPI001C4D4D71|nr:uncharacterized protein LOC122021656 isoform X1 [Zingiber officinale]
MQEAGGEMSEHEKTKRQQEGNPRIDGTSSDIVEESSSTSLEGNQVVLKKNKKKKTKILEIEEVRGISDGKLEIDAEKDVKEAELEQHGNQDGKKKRRKDRDGDEGGNEAPKGAKNRKRKQEDGGLVNLNVDANTKKRKKDNVFEISDLSSGATPGEVSGDENKTSGKVADADNHTVCENSTGKIENVKAKRNKNDKKLEIPKHLVLETLEVQRHMVVENEVSTNDDKLHILVNKAKTKAKRVLDSCEHKENSHETCTNGSQSLSMEVRKEIQEIREMPSTSTAINVKRKKSKEKDGNAENQEAEEHSKNPLKIKGKIRKPFQTVEAEGNKETSNVMKEKEADDSVACSLKSKKSFSNGSNISSLKKKKVTFSSEIEVFTYRTDSGNEGNSEIPVIQGKHFTKEEDEKILEAIDEYIKRNQLGEMGKSMILHFQNYSNITDFWKEIGACLPNRHREATYNRAHVLLERSKSSKLKPEEYETLFRFYAKHGPDWKTIACELRKHWKHVEDTRQRTKSQNFSKGTLSPEEYQIQCDLVNMDLQLKDRAERSAKQYMLRDNIPCEVINEPAACRMKGYQQIASPLVMKNLWSDKDDYLLVDALMRLDACCVEDVDWDNLLEHRPGDICRKRWTEMTRYIGENKEKSFIEQVEVLSQHYSEMTEYRK